MGFCPPGSNPGLWTRPSQPASEAPGYTIPVIDWAHDAARQVVVDREPGQCLGHPTTVLLEDGQTLPESNASAIGAVVRAKSTLNGIETWQMRQVFAGGQTPLVQHDPRPNFGLGNATVADMVLIEWPSRAVQELTNVAADQILTVVEPPGLRVESGGQLSWPVTADGYRFQPPHVIMLPGLTRRSGGLEGIHAKGRGG